MTYPGKNHQIRVGVVGLGFGAAVHIPGFRKLDNVDVVVIAGSQELKAKRIAKELGVASGISGYQSILDFKVDVVSIALPPKLNYEAAQFFLSKKIPVLCEKPISQTVSEANRLLELSKGVLNAVNFQFAELNAFKIAKKIIEDEDLGKIKKIKIKWLTRSFANRNKLENWKRNVAESGGVISLLVTHTMYLLLWFKSPIVILSSRLMSDNEQYTGKLSAEDTCYFQAKLKSGEDVEAYISNNSKEKTLHMWEFFCKNGVLVLKNETNDYMSGFQVYIDHGDNKLIEKYVDSGCENNQDGRIQPFSSLADRFIKSIETGEIIHPNFYDAQLVQKYIDALFRSHFNKTKFLIS
jgi:predicted dehydrogenase